MSALLGTLLTLFILAIASGAVIEQVDDTDLIHMLTGEDNVIVLFCKYTTLFDLFEIC